MTTSFNEDVVLDPPNEKKARRKRIEVDSYASAEKKARGLIDMIIAHLLERDEMNEDGTPQRPVYCRDHKPQRKSFGPRPY